MPSVQFKIRGSEHIANVLYALAVALEVLLVVVFFDEHTATTSDWQILVPIHWHIRATC